MRSFNRLDILNSAPQPFCWTYPTKRGCNMTPHKSQHYRVGQRILFIVEPADAATAVMPSPTFFFFRGGMMVCGGFCVVSAVHVTKNSCRSPLCVGSTCNVGEKSATYAHVADMAPTCRRHSGLRRERRKPSLTSRIATNISPRLGIVGVVALSRVPVCSRLCRCRNVSITHGFDHFGRHIVTKLFDLFPNVT